MQFMQVVIVTEAQKLAKLLADNGLRDGEIKRLLGVSQSNASRLRNGKIKKVSKYIDALERSGSVAASRDFEACMADLARLSESDSALMALLQNLHRLMRKCDAT
jgi:predicted transcriptional regulator